MAYIGNTVQNQGFAPAVDYFNGDGTTVTFTLSRPVASVAQLTAVIDNVIQNPSSAFTVSGNAITFTSAPLAGTNNIWVEYTSLVTTYAAISQDPSVIGDITASGGYLSTGDFGNSYIDGTIVDYVTGNARITTGPADGLTIYNGGTSARTALASWSTAGVLTNTSNAVINGIMVGKGTNSNAYSTAVGVSALNANTGDNNTAVGYTALQSNAAGNTNTAVGSFAMSTNTTGSSNTGIGQGSMYTNLTGTFNTAIGQSSLYSNSSGGYNVAVGVDALKSNSTSNYNTAVGYQALYSSTGPYNVAIGYKALYSNTGGDNNIAIGQSAMYKNTGGTNNIAIGNSAGYWLAGGVNNTIVGDSAGGLSGSNFSGSSNTCIGVAAGQSLTTGNYNTYIGNAAGLVSSTASNEMVISANSSASGKGTNTGFITAGGGANMYQGNNSSSWATTSDQRIKENIAPIGASLDKILALVPSEFDYKEDESHDVGFIAQEYQTVFPDQIIEHEPNEAEKEWVTEGKVLGIQTNLVPYLVKAIQEQQAMIEELKTKVAALEAK